MKKILIILLLLAGFSAYALNGRCLGNRASLQHKQQVKKTTCRSISPIADVFSFSF